MLTGVVFSHLILAVIHQGYTITIFISERKLTLWTPKFIQLGSGRTMSSIQAVRHSLNHYVIRLRTELRAPHTSGYNNR